jgi:SWI/SNF-related matrix-associated actin-dependent regulator of chromatin subfamily A member 5
MNDKLTDFEKGDMYNFKLDGGKASNTQMFEGKDYSDKSMREGDLLSSMPFYIDVGKRERKAVQEYNPAPIAAVHKEREPEYNAPKMPRHLRLPRMEDWQFYDRARLAELSEMEGKLFDELVERKETIDKSPKFVLLPPELHEEKLRLLETAFSSWTKMHFNNFVRACARYGRNEPAKIAKDIGRPTEEVARYAEAFFSRGADVFSPAELERIMKQIEKGERRLEEIQRLSSATGQLINMFADPWEELTFKNVGNVGRIFNSVEDRYLLCLTLLHGFGSWDLIRASIRRCERFRFDYFLQSCSSETLGKRCEMLMRSAERELLEIDKKRQQLGGAADGAAPAKDVSAVDAVASAVAANQERLKELAKQIAVENKHMSNARAALQKLSAPAENIASAFSKDKDKAGFNADKSASGATKAAVAAQPSAPVASADGGEKRGLGAEAKVVPEELLPELAAYVLAAAAFA